MIWRNVNRREAISGQNQVPLKKRASLLWSFLVVVAQVFSGLRAERNYRSLPEILPTGRQKLPGGAEWPGVSIIVPVRNEEMNLPRLLDSLVIQDYPLFEVIVVDDASTDCTSAVVRRYERHGVRLLHSDGPPAGWTGKNHACWLGASASKFPWLLFVDADVTLARLALRSSLAFALQHEAGALSLFARQHCETFWERLLLPFAYQQYFVGVNARRVHGRGEQALANGQYFLINHESYHQVGGHAANAYSIIDDVALATSLKKAGITPLACRGESLITVRMYTGLRAIIEGFGKNSFLFLRQSPATGVQSAVSTLLAASVPLLFVAAWYQRSKRIAGLALLAYVVQMLNIKPWLRRFGGRFAAPGSCWLSPDDRGNKRGVSNGCWMMTGMSLFSSGSVICKGPFVSISMEAPGAGDGSNGATSVNAFGPLARTLGKRGKVISSSRSICV